MANSNKYLKGQDVNVYVNGSKIMTSRSCSISYTMNTEDVSSKDDDDFYFDNSSPTTLEWEVSNESFIAASSVINDIMQMWLNREMVEVMAKDGNGRITLDGYAQITSLSVEATMGEYATLSVTLSGTGTDILS